MKKESTDLEQVTGTIQGESQENIQKRSKPIQVLGVFQEYQNSLKIIWNSTILSYTHFVHWNTAKILIMLRMSLILFIMILPFLIIGVITLGVITGGMSESELSGLYSGGLETALFFQDHIGAAIFLAVVGIIGFLTVILCLSYNWYLLGLLSFSYDSGERPRLFRLTNETIGGFTGYIKSEYQSFKRYMIAISWASIRIVVLVLGVFAAYFLLFLLTYLGLIDQSSDFSKMILGILSIIGTGILMLGSLFFLIRYMYVPLLLANKDFKDLTPREIAQLSWRQTKGKVLKIIAIIVPFTLALGTINFAFVYAEEVSQVKSIEIKMLTAQKTLGDAYENDHTYVQTQLINPEALSEDDLRKIIALGNTFEPQETGFNVDYIKEMLPYINQSGTLDEWSDIGIVLLFGFLSFILFGWIEGQILFGTYKAINQK